MPRAFALTTILTLAAVAAAAPASFAQGPPAEPPAQSPGTARAGGAEYDTAVPVATPTVPGAVAVIADGIAYAPADAPDPVKAIIWAGNQIVDLPYRLGGGHTPDFKDSAYDCSGTISFALHGAGLLARPRDSSSFLRWGDTGPGLWVTVFTRSSHAYMTVAGIRLDTSAASDPSGRKGPQWRPLRPSDRGYKVRHPAGL